jgi:flagellar protein FliS
MSSHSDLLFAYSDAKESQKNLMFAYSKAKETLPLTKQVVAVYDGAINALKQAQASNNKNDIESRYNLLNKALTLVVGLQTCLDFEKGGEIANILFSFYSTVESNIWTLHRQPSEDNFSTVIEMLSKMRDVWEELDTESNRPLYSDVPQTGQI